MRLALVSALVLSFSSGCYLAHELGGDTPLLDASSPSLLDGSSPALEDASITPLRDAASDARPARDAAVPLFCVDDSAVVLETPTTGCATTQVRGGGPVREPSDPWLVPSGAPAVIVAPSRAVSDFARVSVSFRCGADPLETGTVWLVSMPGSSCDAAGRVSSQCAHDIRRAWVDIGSARTVELLIEADLVAEVEVCVD